MDFYGHAGLLLSNRGFESRLPEKEKMQALGSGSRLGDLCWVQGGMRTQFDCRARRAHPEGEAKYAEPDAVGIIPPTRE